MDVLGTVSDGEAVIAIRDVVVFEQHVRATSREAFPQYRYKKMVGVEGLLERTITIDY